MAAKVGDNAYIYFKGTDIAGDFRNLDDSSAIGLVDATAGADACKTFLTTITEGEAKWSALWQDTAAGDAAYLLLAPGAEGSLIIGPNGSASGAAKTTVNAIVKDRNRKIPYDDVIEIEATLVRSGTASEGTF